MFVFVYTCPVKPLKILSLSLFTEHIDYFIFASLLSRRRIQIYTCLVIEIVVTDVSSHLW